MKKIVYLLAIIFFYEADAQCYKEVGISQSHVIAINSNNHIVGWGLNNGGQLATSLPPNNVLNPISVNNQFAWSKIWALAGNTFALKNDNTLWACGLNNFGTLGIGQTGSTSVLTQIGTASNWSKLVSNGVFTIALKVDGTLWGWGDNQNGQLGLGSGAPTQVLSPIQIGTANHWTDIAVSCCGSFALKNDGTVWGTGLQINPFLDWFTGPDPVNLLRQGYFYDTTASSWVPNNGIAKIKAGDSHMMALKTDGTLVVWGVNSHGELGMPLTFVQSTKPLPIGGSDTWLDFATGNDFCLAVKSDGTLWAWGRNNYGQLGLGHTNDVLTPTQVGTDTNWEKINAAGTSTSLGIKNDGSIWVWGRNNFGQFGNGTLTQSNVPLLNSAICAVPLANEEFIKPIFSIAPNPAKEFLQINFQEASEATITIYDMQGRVVNFLNITNNDKEINIPISNWQSGIYLVQIVNKNGLKGVEKVVVE